MRSVSADDMKNRTERLGKTVLPSVFRRLAFAQKITKLQFYPPQNVFRGQVSQPGVIRGSRGDGPDSVSKFHLTINLEQVAGVRPWRANNRVVTLPDRARAAGSRLLPGQSPGPESV